MRSDVSSAHGVAILLVLVGCGESAPSDVATTDAAGVAIVTSTATDKPMPWTLTEMFRIVVLDRECPVPTTPDMATREHPDGWTVSFGSDRGCPLDPSAVAEQLGLASHLPVIPTVACGPRGTLWVDRHVFPGEPAVTDVFDREGAYLGTVHRKGLPLGWLGDDRVLFAIGDEETGVSVIGVYRISDSPGGGPAS